MDQSKTPVFDITLLPASFGDSILISYGLANDLKYILIDGGPYYALENIGSALRKAAPGLMELELLIVTHIDIDHIDGIIRMLNQENLPFQINEIWFNGYNQIKEYGQDDRLLGYKQGEYLSALINEKKIPQNRSHFEGKAIVVKSTGDLLCITLDGGFKITLLSPDASTLAALAKNWEEESSDIANKDVWLKKLEGDQRYRNPGLLGDDTVEELQQTQPVADDSIENHSSIAFIGTYAGRSCLFAGDAPTDILLKNLQPLLDRNNGKQLRFDAWKIAHHGSRKSTLSTLMTLLSAPKLLISSDGKRYGHPNEDTIAKLLLFNQRPLTFYFNYTSTHNARWGNDALKNQYNYTAVYGEDENGLKISLIRRM